MEHSRKNSVRNLLLVHEIRVPATRPTFYTQNRPLNAIGGSIDLSATVGIIPLSLVVTSSFLLSFMSLFTLMDQLSR